LHHVYQETGIDITLWRKRNSYIWRRIEEQRDTVRHQRTPFFVIRGTTNEIVIFTETIPDQAKQIHLKNIIYIREDNNIHRSIINDLELIPLEYSERSRKDVSSNSQSTQPECEYEVLLHHPFFGITNSRPL
jgi:hypothetical protein